MGRRNTPYIPTQDEETFIGNILGIANVLREEIAYEFAMKKAHEMRENGLDIDPEKIPIYLGIATKRLRRKGADIYRYRSIHEALKQLQV